MVIDYKKYKISERNTNIFSVDYSDILGYRDPVGSCGLFSIQGISDIIDYLDEDDGDDGILKLNNDYFIDMLIGVIILSKKFNKYHCLCLDNEENYTLYKDEIKPLLVQEGEYFINPSSNNKTKLFILDVHKIIKYIESI